MIKTHKRPFLISNKEPFSSFYSIHKCILFDLIGDRLTKVPTRDCKFKMTILTGVHRQVFEFLFVCGLD